MHIWNTGKSFKNGSVPVLLPHFHTYFQTLSSMLSVLLKLEAVSIIRFCLLLVRLFSIYNDMSNTCPVLP